MKKLVIACGITLVSVGSCNKDENTSYLQKAAVETSSTLKTLSTLNGIPYFDAAKMVAAYRNDTVNHSEATSVWFSKAYVNALVKLFDTNVNRNGIRIYYAKISNVKNAILLVSTIRAAIGGNDILESNLSFLGTLQNGVDYNNYSYSKFQPGATLFSKACNDNGCSTENTVDCKVAKSWLDEFRCGPMTTKSVFYPAQIIRKLAYELNDAPISLSADGIRIYFVRKPATTSKVATETFVFVTTANVGDVHTDYYECHITAAHMADLIQIKKSTTFKTAAEDNGEECPQNCTGDQVWPDGR